MTQRQVTIGIDVGTTGTKLVALDVEQGLIGQVTMASDLISLQPGYAEADPMVWSDNIMSGLRQLITQTGLASTEVAGIAATGMVPAVLLLDDGGRPLRAAILQNDARAISEIDEVRDALASYDPLNITGSAVTQQSVGPTALWLARNEPEVWARTRHIVGSYDYALMSLGARPHVEDNWAIESGLFTLTGDRFEQSFEVAGIDHRIVPEVVRPGTVVGGLSREAAEETGLRPGTPLVVGGADHVLSAFAAGVQNPGDCLVKLGGAGDILAASAAPVVDARVYLDAHPVPGLWLPNGCMATSGSLIRWIQGLLGGIALPELDDQADQRDPAQVLCLPYFLGEKSPLHDPQLRGVFAGLHLGVTGADLYRAVLEGIAFGFKHHVEVFDSMGMKITRALVTNGGSRSRFWKQIHADVLNVPLFPVIDHPGASLAAAEIAAIGIGLLPDWDSIQRFLELGDPVMPRQDNVDLYAQAYDDWRALGETTTPISHNISERTQSL